MRGVRLFAMLLSVACDDGDVLVPDDAGPVEVPATNDNGEPSPPIEEAPCMVEPAVVPFECEKDADFCLPMHTPEGFFDLAAMWSRRENDTWIIEIRLHGRWFVFPETEQERDTGFGAYQLIKLYWLNEDNDFFTGRCISEDFVNYGPGGTDGLFRIFFARGVFPAVEELALGVSCIVADSDSSLPGSDDRCGFVGAGQGADAATTPCSQEPAELGGCDDLLSISEDLTTVRFVDRYHYIPDRPFAFFALSLGSPMTIDGCVYSQLVEVSESRGGSSGLTFFPLSQYRDLCLSYQQ
jgi:hypothetical protein